jgi:hypothetical protein
MGDIYSKDRWFSDLLSQIEKSEFDWESNEILTTEQCFNSLEIIKTRKLSNSLDSRDLGWRILLNVYWVK